MPYGNATASMGSCGKPYLALSAVGAAANRVGRQKMRFDEFMRNVHQLLRRHTHVPIGSDDISLKDGAMIVGGSAFRANNISSISLEGPPVVPLLILIGAGVAAIFFELYAIAALPIGILLVLYLRRMRADYRLVINTDTATAFVIADPSRSLLLSIKQAIEEEMHRPANRDAFEDDRQDRVNRPFEPPGAAPRPPGER